MHVVVGAPDSNLDTTKLKAGRAYVYRNNGNGFELMGEPIVGTGQNHNLGTAVDISSDGSRVLIGVPGAKVARYYEWDGSSWQSIFKGSAPTGRYGESVAIVKGDGSIIAVGAPRAGSQKGNVLIYAEVGGSWKQVGPTMVGDSGSAHLGSSLSASNGRLFVGTKNMQTFLAVDVDVASDTWTQVGRKTKLGNGVSAVSGAGAGNAVLVGLSSEKVELYEFQD